jgi:hypothetical protein
MKNNNLCVCYVPVPVQAAKKAACDTAVITFRVADENGCPVVGSVYKLTDVCDNYIHAISDKNGCVSFKNIQPGKYVLTELSPACGFKPEADSWKIVVKNSECIKIDGVFSRHFCHSKERTDAPDIAVPNICCYTITGDQNLVIKGTGLPGYIVQISANGYTCSTKVHRDGTWTLDAPEDLNFNEVQELNIAQCNQCGYQSEVKTITRQQIIDWIAGDPDHQRVCQGDCPIDPLNLY